MFFIGLVCRQGTKNNSRCTGSASYIDAAVGAPERDPYWIKLTADETDMISGFASDSIETFSGIGAMFDLVASNLYKQNYRQKMKITITMTAQCIRCKTQKYLSTSNFESSNMLGYWIKIGARYRWISPLNVDEIPASQVF